MDVDCLAHSSTGSCSIVRVAVARDGIAIRSSVGAGGTNRPDDARTIQSALNEVPNAKGGPSPALKVDGIVGPKTIAGIRRFQQAHGTVVDARIDPTGRTLTALNRELGASSVPVAAAPGAGGSAVGGPGKPEFLPPDPAITALVLELLGRTRDVIRAANFRLLSAGPFVGNGKLTPPTGPFQSGARDSVAMLDTVFSLGKFANPRPPFDNIRRVFQNMDVALNRTFETAPLIAPVLFVPNTHISMESKAAAYTAAGGAFLSQTVKLAGIGEPANRIYVCRNALPITKLQQVRILVHELAHFVSGQPISIVDQVSEFSMLDAGSRPKFDAISPDRKLRSAEHYAFFAIVARFPQFLKPT